jgi:hypothetical protein
MTSRMVRTSERQNIMTHNCQPQYQKKYRTLIIFYFDGINLIETYQLVTEIHLTNIRQKILITTKVKYVYILAKYNRRPA